MVPHRAWHDHELIAMRGQGQMSHGACGFQRLFTAPDSLEAILQDLLYVATALENGNDL
jgi:hypothetical protein